MPTYFYSNGNQDKFVRRTRRKFLNSNMDGFGDVMPPKPSSTTRKTKTQDVPIVKKTKVSGQTKTGKSVYIVPSGGGRVKVTQVNSTQAQAVSNNGGTIIKKRSDGDTQVVNNGGGITDKIFSIVSQWISGNSRNQTVQTIGGTVPLYQNQQGDGGSGQTVVYTDETGAVISGGTGQTVGATLGGGLDGIFGWVQNNLGLVAIGVGGVYLLMKSPPKYGNR